MLFCFCFPQSGEVAIATTATATASHHDVARHTFTPGVSILGGNHVGAGVVAREGATDRLRAQGIGEKVDTKSLEVSKASSSPAADKGKEMRDRSDAIPGEAAAVESVTNAKKTREKVAGQREPSNRAATATASSESPGQRVGAGSTAHCDIENKGFDSEKGEVDEERGGDGDVKPWDAKQYDSSSNKFDASGAGFPSEEACSSDEQPGQSWGTELSPILETANRVRTKSDADDGSPESRSNEEPGCMIESALANEQGKGLHASVPSRDDIQREGLEGDDDKGSKPLEGYSQDRPETVERDDSSDVRVKRNSREGNEGLVFRGEVGVAGFNGGVDEMEADDAEDVSRLVDMDEEELAVESERLRRDGNKARRDAETVTDEMKEEVKGFVE